MSADFKFKNFIISQDGASHKVGVDSVLLGAWCSAIEAVNILDIGTGTGLLALMMAQKFPLAKIDAVEIDKQAFDCAKANFSASPYYKRLIAHNISVQQFINNVKYDLIICNPPYFNGSMLPYSDSKKIARHTIELEVAELYEHIFRLLGDTGEAYLIIPTTEIKIHLETSRKIGLYLVKHCSVLPKFNKVANREMLCFAKSYKALQWDEIVLRDTDNLFTNCFKKLTKDFYIKL